MKKHEVVAEHYRSAIQKRALTPGDAMPSLQEVMVQHRCSINVATNAYKLLKREGLIVPRTGRGTVVAPSADVAVLAGAASADRRDYNGANQGDGESLTGRTAYAAPCADPETAAILDIDLDSDVVVRQRQRRDANGLVNWWNTGYTHYRAVAVVPELLDSAPMGGGWPDLYRQRCGKVMRRIKQDHTARLATPSELTGLEIDSLGGAAAVPVMVKRLIWADDDGPIDVWIDVMRPGLWDVQSTSNPITLETVTK